MKNNYYLNISIWIKIWTFRGGYEVILKCTHSDKFIWIGHWRLLRFWAIWCWRGRKINLQSRTRCGRMRWTTWRMNFLRWALNHTFSLMGLLLLRRFLWRKGSFFVWGSQSFWWEGESADLVTYHGMFHQEHLNDIPCCTGQ